jgi:light-regulated signal transduction histidine kinase (bacteriophytochrome)
MFTKRIYHTHHKAEKVMGYIKEDLRSLNSENIQTIKNRVTKYANFVSRVIYDMKWYDPPIQTIRNQVFNTDINEVVKFIVDNLFLRLSTSTNIYTFNLKLEDNVPKVHVNEFVVWEIIEPLIQNSIDHAGNSKTMISIKSEYFLETNKTLISISDNGVGIQEELLEENENGIKKIFAENISTKSKEEGKSGYGCYIAYQMATVRCGWKLDALNLTDGGSLFKIEIQN